MGDPTSKKIVFGEVTTDEYLAALVAAGVLPVSVVAGKTEEDQEAERTNEVAKVAEDEAAADPDDEEAEKKAKEARKGAEEAAEAALEAKEAAAEEAREAAEAAAEAAAGPTPEGEEDERTVAELQDELRDADLPVSGTKAELVERLEENE